MLYRTIQSSWIIHEYTHRQSSSSSLLTHKRIIIIIITIMIIIITIAGNFALMFNSAVQWILLKLLSITTHHYCLVCCCLFIICCCCVSRWSIWSLCPELSWVSCRESSTGCLSLTPMESSRKCTIHLVYSWSPILLAPALFPSGS